MNQANNIRLGFIGAGWVFTECLGPSFRNNPRFNMVALADANSESAQFVAREFGIECYFSGYMKMLQQVKLDAVVIATPPYLHCPMTLECLGRGLHVLCEKPPAMDVKETKQMISAARKSQKFLHFGMCYRHMDNSVKLRETVNSGILGTIYFGKAGWLNQLTASCVFSAESWKQQKNKVGGGPLMGFGVHTIDRTMWAMGYPEPMSVYAKTFDAFGKTLVPKTTIEDLAVGFVNLKNGVTIYIENSQILNGSGGFYYNEFFGTNGGISICRDKRATLYCRDDTSLTSMELVDNLEFDSEVIYRRQTEIFAAGIEKGIVDNEQHNEMITLMRIVTGLYESARTGNIIHFE
jgi:predicted dehydrogenase